MKKHFLFTCMAIVALLMGACNEEENLRVHDGNGVTFNVTIPELGTSTRAVGDGLTATTLYWGVYDHNNVLLQDISNTTNNGHKVYGGKTFSKSTKLTLTLAQDKKYSIIFWAANADNSMCTVDWDARKMTVNPAEANQESYDAFCKYEVIDNVSGYMTRDVKLKRPFAQLNIGTADIAKAAASGLTVKNTKVVIEGLPTTYFFENNPQSEAGKVDTEGKAAFTYGYSVPAPVYFKEGKVAVSVDGDEDTDAFPVTGYDYLSMNYALIGADKELVDVTFTYKDDDDQEHTRTYSSVPVQRNWRTNIYGNILTSEADFTVTIVPEFDGAHNIKVWDGKTLDTPTIDDLAKTVTITTGGQLAWLAASVNGTLTRAESVPANTYAGWTVLLGANIDLGGEEWTPIGLNKKRFMGTFDGQGRTISNLKISTADNGAQAALFGDVTGAVIKNFIIDNAQILYPANYSGDFYGAAVVSQAYKVTLQGITVKNSTIQGNNKVAAILAHDADGAAMIIENCHVEGCTIETKNDADGGNAAGIVGSVQGSKNTKSLKNCSVKKTTFNVINSADAGKRSNAQMVATVIATAETVLTLEDCVVENNTFNQSGVVNFVSPYDGIFVGGARTEETGTVIINGVPYGALKLNNEYYWSIDEALKAAKAGDVIYVGSGNYVIPASVTTSPAGTITFEGYGNNSVLSFNSKPGGADGGLNSYADGMELVFKNLKVVSPNTGNAYTGGFGRAKSVAFEGCTYEGQYRSMSPVTFTGCTIDPMTSYIYTDYSNATFTGCTFNCSEGKGIQVYNDGNSTNTTITVENCTFKAAKIGYTWDSKPVTAIDINSNGEKFTVNITNTTATGFGEGLFSNSQLWNIKGGEEHVTLYIDGKLLIATSAQLKSAVAAGHTDIYMLAGTYDTKDFGFMNKTLYLKGVEDGVKIYNSQNNAVASGSFDMCTVTFENLTIETRGGNYKGFARMNGTYRNCTIVNNYFTCYGKHEFVDCTFNAPALTGSDKNEHCMWTYGAEEVDFVNCKFNYSDRCVNVYVDNGGNAPGITSDVAFTNCVFNTENTASEGAVEVNSTPFTAGVKVTLNGCTAPTYGKMVYVSPWDGTKGKTATITVDGKLAAGLESALANAVAGSTIVLSEGADLGTVTVGELKGVTIQGAKGTVMIFKTTADTKIENVTLQNVNFEYTGATADCGVVIDANAQIDNLVLEGCTFTGTGAKAGRGLSGFNNNASIKLKGCTFKDLGYPVYAWGSYKALTIEGCTFDNIKSWAIMPQSGFDGNLTVTGCTFKDCLGGGLIKAGTLTAGHTFTFTDNTITGCTIAGDHNWFQFNVSAGTSVISGNTKDGADWTPTATDGLK